MSARIHGFTNTTLAPGPDLFLSRDPDGKTTAQREFTCLKTALPSPFIQSRLAKGIKITTLCSDIPVSFQHLEIDSHSSRDEPGGFTRVTINFTGYTEEGEFGFDREINYSLRGSLAERPIIEHPNYIREMRDEEVQESNHKGIVGLYHGRAFVVDMTANDPEIRDTQSQASIVTITDATARKWYKKIHVDGIRTYLAPSYEWTRSTANAGGLANADIARFGLKDDPPGDPPTPEGVTGWWQMVDLDDSRSSNASSNSITWRFIEGEVDTDLYDY